MPMLTGVITSTTVSANGFKRDPNPAPVLTTVPAGTIKQLHSELAAVGLTVTGMETSGTPQFGPETQARVRDFQVLHGLPVSDTVSPETGALITLAAKVVTETDRSKLQAELRDAQGKIPDSPLYNYWLARYAILAGDFDLAIKVRPRAAELQTASAGPSAAANAELLHGIDLSGLGEAVAVLDVPSGPPQKPEVPFPENFYTYQYNLMAQDDIDKLRTEAPVDLAGGPKPLLARRRPQDDTNTEDPPGTPPVHPPQPPAPPDQRPQRRADSARAFLDAVEAWQLGISEFGRQRYNSAVAAFNRCQQATLDYFHLFPDYQLAFASATLSGSIDELVFNIFSDTVTWADVLTQLNWRRQLLSLAELGQYDWTPITEQSNAFVILQGNLAGKDQPLPPNAPLGLRHRKIFMDTHLLILAAVLVPLARAEANRLRRQYAAAVDDLTRFLRREIPVPNSNPPKTIPASLACDFIEAPFARLLMAETLLDQGEAEYKARLSVDDEADAALKADEVKQLKTLADDFKSRKIPQGGDPSAPFQNLVAALTYSEILELHQPEGEYVTRARQALDSLHASITSAVDSGDVNSVSFMNLGQTITIPTLAAVGNTLPGLTEGTHPHEPYLKFTPPESQKAMREKNPRVYGILLAAQARLLQIWSGFNYLGYPDDYLPPWRFQYLLDRSRYFAEHAKNAQRDYLNFLSNAENEELKELNAAQNVELEKANVQVETARVDQVTKEVAASKESAKLADKSAKDADQRVKNFQEFQDQINSLENGPFGSSILGIIGSTAGSVALAIGGAVATGGISLAEGGAVVAGLANAVTGLQRGSEAQAQRDLEQKNLQLAAGEARQAKKVADAQLAVAKASLVVAGLQRQAALLRHEFALQSLQFMRNRVLNTEQWYRLAGAIRSVSDTYLRYAIETSFLAQQAYNFESDRRLNVIRFDYDLSDVGALLAADFLLRDLDTLEQDLVVTQQQRQQQVRYIVSLARDYPQTLQDLADQGEVSFSVRLEQLEKHFPGLFDMRISSVDVLPVALMDPTRLTVQLTHAGAGMVRLQAQPGSSPLNKNDVVVANDPWLANLRADWPVKMHISGLETAVFSGISRQEAASLSQINASQRGAFEGLPGASSWRLDLSMKENQIVPGTLADVLMTFTLSGLYDSDLYDAVTAAASSQRSFAPTSLISARQSLPDAFYSLSRDGKLDWDISERMLTLSGSTGSLRNLGVVLPLVQNGIDLGRCCCSYPIDIEITKTGEVRVITLLPKFTLTSNKLVLNCASTFTDVDVTWDFGDGSPLVRGANAQHRYNQPGRYEVLTRLAKNGRLDEYRSAVYVSQNQSVTPPLIVAPSISFSGTDLTVSVDSTLGVDCAIGSSRASGTSGSAKLTGIAKGAIYKMTFAAVRRLSALFYSKQRFLPSEAVNLDRNRVSTNRTFNTDGKETTTAPNAFTTHIFGGQTLAPDDRWTLELPLDKNPWFVGVSSSDVTQFDGSELSDAVISLEYLVA